ncbi:DJ-1 family glyoxalase III [Miniphocaeibacter massiliensis]|uniref:DJ-1 family glyoxalase III n=1 Tax=Miniphocaeibacter massiliensis TaxID=2041841 RepID=UPI000C1B823C|nr:DJ-1 family glyoxalase III [Miniphocaeibacter massiliensis]
MKKVIVLLADGVEEVEALTQVDYLRRAGIEVDMVSANDGLSITGAHNIRFKAEEFIEDIELKDVDAVIVPGGLKGVENLIANEKVLEVLEKMNSQNKLIAAICAGPLVLYEAGVLEGKVYTCYPGIEEKIFRAKFVKQSSITDGNIITAPGPAYAQKLAFKVVRYLLEREDVKKLKNEILYKKY